MKNPTAPAIPSKAPVALGRREFLLGATGAFILTACQCGDPAVPPPQVVPTPDAGADAGVAQDPGAGFRAWEQMRQAARQSPDHLAARAEALVAAKDVEGLYLFVRDQIVTVPAEHAAIGDQLKLRFGARGALRAGAGSMRDKAELLVDLYTRAGFEAQVYEGSVRSGADFVQRALVRHVDHTFAPPVTVEQVEAWQAVLQTPAPTGARQTIDADGTQAQALAQALLGQLPATLAADPFSFFAPLYQPLVRVVVDGTERFANVTLPDLPFGETDSTITPRPTGAAVPPPPVKVTLKAAITGRTDQPALVSAEVPALELIGRSLFAGFVPVEDLPGLDGKKLGEVRTFIPSLVLRGPGMTAQQKALLSWAGAPVTLWGDVMRIEGDQLFVRDLPVDTSPFDPARAAAVQSLQVTADAALFPELRLRVQAQDAAGASVVGLPASAFAVEEDGARMGFSLVENAPPPPRVLFILDRSSSMPAEFRDAGAGELCRDVATQLLASDPRCQFRIHVVDGNPAEGVWTSDPAVIQQAAQNQAGVGSNLWTALAAGAGLGASTIVMITDGDATDASTPELIAAITQAPPSLFLQVLNVSTAHLDAMAEITSGRVLPVADHTEAINQIRDFLIAREKNAYLLRYVAPQEGTAQRTVRVAIRGSAVSATGVYTPPAARLPRSRIGGLLFSVESAGEQPLTRVWAGTRRPAADAPEALYDEVEGAFFGSAELHFEGGPPTVAALLDDWLTTRLEYEPVLAAINAPDATIDDMQRAFTARPPAYHLGAWIPHVALPTQAQDEVLYRTGLRVSMLARVPRFGAALLRRLDLLPWGKHRTIAATQRRAFEATVTSTARLALMEQAFFETSTAAALAGVPLTHIRPGYEVASVLTVTPEERAKWNAAMDGYFDYHRLVPTSLAPVMFWAVDRASGEMLGVLESGAGGGEGATDGCDLNRLLDGLDRLGSLMGATGALGSAAGTWYSLEITKARKLLAATVVISGGTPRFTDPADWRDFFGGAACGAATGALGAGLGRLSGRNDGFGVAAGVMGRILNYDGYVAAATGRSMVCNAPSTGSPSGCG